MSSIIEGYNYDIFISYRQKDNKHDGWVTEFVNNLKGELESTFKEEISVYFDINPHDGLLETHDVDASLKEKLKCLVFIPIISRTYCDPKSFAWEHEFKEFVEQASEDQFGLKIKLPNGNVASRILPIRIHDLDADDNKLCESVLGGVLRGIEFIYKEPGVNKPLTATDNEKKNLNNTNYKIQINKTANAIKEIVSGLKTGTAGSVMEKIQLKGAEKEVNREKSIEEHQKPAKLKMIKIQSGFLITAILIMVAILAYLKIFKRDNFENIVDTDGKISIAVMPFQNITNDTILNFIIQNSIITSLSNNSGELKVRQIESITGLLQSKGLTNYASITPSIASTISKKLDANIFIIGSMTQTGNTVRLNAQLINSKTKETFKAFQIDGTAKDILSLSDSLSKMVANFLIVSILKKEVPPDTRKFGSTLFPSAYRYFILGQNAFSKEDYPTAIEFYSQAIKIDTNFYFAALEISQSYYNQVLLDSAKKWCLKVYKKIDQMAPLDKIWTHMKYAQCFETPYEQIKYADQFMEIDDQQPIVFYIKGANYNNLGQFDKSIPEFEKSLEIYNNWGTKPMWVANYIALVIAYYETGQLNKARKLCKIAEIDFPDHIPLYFWQIVLSLSQGDSVAAEKYTAKYISLCKDDSWTQTDITGALAEIYKLAGFPNKAEQYYRQALVLDPENPWRMNLYGYFLIDKDRNIAEGLKLVNKALEISPDSYDFLDSKGWGLYKQSKYKEALEILQKSWDLRMKNAIYDHSAFLHLEVAKKAVANQKNN